VKDLSPYSITPYSSSQPDAVKIAKIITSGHRLITLSATDQYFKTFWQAYRTCHGLIKAGYPGALVTAHEGGRLCKNKNLIIAGMEIFLCLSKTASLSNGLG